jgi:mono/diheme cytochrome c family protein
MRRIVIVFVVMLLLVGCGNDEGNENNGPTLEPEAAAGRQLFRTHCATCHAVEGDRMIVGPSLEGVANRAGSRVDDLDAAEYLHESIVAPNAYIVEGFATGTMPQNFAVDLTSEEVGLLVTYLLTLR